MSAERIITVNVAGSKPPAPPWEIVKGRGRFGAGPRRTVHHRRPLSHGQWLIVTQEGDGWRWRRYADFGRAPATVQAEGIEPTWQAARAAADEETRATWYAQGCPEVLT